MKSDGVQFEFMGFDPEFEIKNLMKAIGERLEGDAPSDSLVKLAVRKSARAVCASCRVVSEAGTFMAEAVSENPVRAVREIEKKIKRQLDGWKKRRFREEG
jgi:ribosome-associated translation inhibitor RaiA